MALKRAIPIFWSLLGLMLVLPGCLYEDVKEGDTHVGIIPTDPEDPFYPGAFVCEAFEEEYPITDVFQGLVGELFYLEEEDWKKYTAVKDYFEFGTPVDQVSLYFNTINVPTRSFDRGFVTSEGEVITTERGDTLYEYFAFRAQADFVLADGEESGLYEFATLTDDGSLLYLNGQLVVDNDGDHSTRMACSEPLQMEKGLRHPLKFEYYQGPRYHIAAIILYRPYAPDRDPECDLKNDKNNRYFDYDQVPSAPQPAFQGLLDRGWRVAQPANYKVPSGLMNMCNFPAPTATNLRFPELTSSSAVFTFDTNVPALHQVVLRNLSTGEETSTGWSKDFYKKHQVEWEGLSSLTRYEMEIFMESPSGRQSQHPTVHFRTRP